MVLARMSWERLVADCGCGAENPFAAVDVGHVVAIEELREIHRPGVESSYNDDVASFAGNELGAVDELLVLDRVRKSRGVRHGGECLRVDVEIPAVKQQLDLVADHAPERVLGGR